MVDSLYKPTHVPAEVRPLFKQLQSEFSAEYEIWVRVEDFGRSVSAGVVNRSKGTAVTIPFRRRSRDIRSTLTPSEINSIRDHLTTGATKDLVI